MGEKIRILLVDEDQDFVQTALPALEGGGYEVVTSATCEEALSKLKESSFSLILLDLIINKRGDGILFARKLRRNVQFKAFSSIPLLMLSDLKQQAGFTFPSPTKHPYYLPIDEFMEKPVSPEALLQKVKDLLKFASV